MGLMRLPESGRAYIDTSALIYIVENVSPFTEKLRSVWDSLLSGKLLLITSELSLMEVMVLPLRRQDHTRSALLRDFLARAYPIDPDRSPYSSEGCRTTRDEPCDADARRNSLCYGNSLASGRCDYQ